MLSSLTLFRLNYSVQLKPRYHPTRARKARDSMAKKSPVTIKRNLRQLRKEIIDSDDIIASRIAYAMECAVRWVTEETVGWGTLATNARAEADLLRRELRQPAGRAEENNV